MKERVVKLTIPEIEHVQWAVARQADTVYYGVKTQYYNRAERIIIKLEEAKKG